MLVHPTGRMGAEGGTDFRHDLVKLAQGQLVPAIQLLRQRGVAYVYRGGQLDHSSDEVYQLDRSVGRQRPVFGDVCLYSGPDRLLERRLLAFGGGGIRRHSSDLPIR